MKVLSHVLYRAEGKKQVKRNQITKKKGAKISHLMFLVDLIICNTRAPQKICKVLQYYTWKFLVSRWTWVHQGYIAKSTLLMKKIKQEANRFYRDPISNFVLFDEQITRKDTYGLFGSLEWAIPSQPDYIWIVQSII